MAAATQPVYFFPGPETGKKRERINSILSTVTAQDGEEPELHKFYPYDTPIVDVISVIQNGSLFASRRVVVFSDVHALKSDGIKAIIAYIHSPTPDAILILTTDQSPGSREYPEKLAGSLPRDSIEVFWEAFAGDKRGWVMHFFREKNIRIESSAVDVLLDITEGTTDALKEACHHLCFSIDPEELILEEDINKVLEHGREETVYSLFDRFCRRDLNGVLDAYHKLMYSSPATMDRFLMLFADPVVHLMNFKQKVSEGLDEGFAAKELRLGGGKRALRSYKEGVHRYSNTELRHAVKSLVDLEAWLRDAPRELRNLKTELWLCRVIGSHNSDQ